MSVDRLRAQAMAKRTRKEDISFRRMVAPLDPNAVTNVVAKAFGAVPQAFQGRRRNSSLRAVAAKCLMRYSGESQRAVADRLGLGTGAAVSAQLKNLNTHLAGDRALRRVLATTEKKLDLLRRQASSDQPRQPMAWHMVSLPTIPSRTIGITRP